MSVSCFGCEQSGVLWGIGGFYFIICDDCLRSAVAIAYRMPSDPRASMTKDVYIVQLNIDNKVVELGKFVVGDFLKVAVAFKMITSNPIFILKSSNLMQKKPLSR